MIIATGGHTGNVEFRHQFDPRLTEEYCGLAGMPWSDQDASGEITAMTIGASMRGLYNQTGEFGLHRASCSRSAISITIAASGSRAAPCSARHAPRGRG